MPAVDHAEQLMRKGDFDEAKNILAEILFEDPNDLRAICDIGIAYTETGENKKAIRALKHYITKNRGNAYAWEALGCACFRIGDFSAAQKNFAHALTLIPEHPSSLRNLGILHGLEGRHELGSRLLKRSAEIAPDDYRTLYALSYALRDLDERKERLAVITRLLEMDLPDNIQHDVKLSEIRLSLGWV